MGHTRLGPIPKSREWQAVVEAITESRRPEEHAGSPSLPDVALVSAKTLDAAQAGLSRAKNDPGLGFTFYLLASIAVASRSPDWLAQLRTIGLDVGPVSSLFDLTLELQRRVDEYLTAKGESTDVSEMAQRAAGEALAVLAGEKAETLFGNSGEELRTALRSLSTKRGFSHLGQTFFARFISQFLDFYISKITADQVGRSGFASAPDVSRFNSALALHCLESARIVRDFCGEWYSKTEFVEGITSANASRFVAVAIDKLSAELRQQRAGL